jgi:hypothetical protein
MNPTTNGSHDGARPDPNAPPVPKVAPDDPRVVRVLEEYLAGLEAGDRPQRDALLARHPDLARALTECLDGLDMMHSLARPESDPAEPGRLLPAEIPADASGTRLLGDYQLLREVGRGGMGIVYEAQQVSLGRRVALKVLPFAATLDPNHLRRFRHEAQAAACLHHPHVVPVFAVGCERGVHYYAMQFIEGRDLASLIQELRRQAGIAGELPATGPIGQPAGEASVGAAVADLVLSVAVYVPSSEIASVAVYVPSSEIATATTRPPRCPFRLLPVAFGPALGDNP